MARDKPTIFAFNRGLITPLALARTDLDRVALSAETYQNFVPRVFGSAMLRPGLGYLRTLGTETWYIPFIFSTTDTALIELTDASMTVLVDDAVITRGSVSSTIANGTFDSNLTSWTDADESGATSQWVSGGYMGLQGSGTTRAIRRQTVSVSAPDQNEEHGIKVVVERGPVTFNVGTSSGDNDLFGGELGSGEYSIAVTPTGANMYLEFSTNLNRQQLVDSVAIESSGAISLTSPYVAADLATVRHDQSADVVYLSNAVRVQYPQYKIERRATRSWGLVLYEPENGPFRELSDGSVTISSSGVSGEVTLTASQPLWKAEHVGALWKIESVGQFVTRDVSAANQFTDEIRISGIGNVREFDISITGTWSGTVTLQRSIAEPGSWVDVNSWTTNQSLSFDDELENQVAYYRIGIKSGDYTSGTATCSLEYSGGSITGIVKLRGYTSATSVTATVLDNLGETEASANWYEGDWSGVRGYPAAVSLFEGRLFWAGKGFVWGSVSDAYESFDDDSDLGDERRIRRTIGQGPVESIHWLLGLERLILGTPGSEKSARSSSFDEPLTQSAFSLKNASTQGSLNVQAQLVDTNGVYVQRSGRRVYELLYDGGKLGYTSVDLTRISPEVCESGVVQMGVQRQPDTRVHCVLSDGTVAMIVYDELEQVRCWLKVVTDGDVEQCVVLPGEDEDQVYYVVNRSTGRFLEKWSMEEECQGGTTSKCVDSHVVYSGAATTSITGLTHLNGKDVVVWADGDSVNDENGDPEVFTVSGGSITLSTAASDVVVGLAYTAKWQSTKLAYASRNPLNMHKTVRQIGLILGPTHRKGLQYGPDFTILDDMPETEQEATVTSDWTAYDSDPLPFDGSWDTDSRVCLQAASPRHATLMGLVIDVESE